MTSTQELTAGDVMTTEVATLAAGERLDLAEDIMHVGRIRHMPVVDGIEAPTLFEDFETFWHPFTLGAAGPAPGYCSSLAEDERLALKQRLAEDLGGNEGSIELPARAWAIRGRVC